MTDNELRGIILKWFYENRRTGLSQPEPENFSPQIQQEDIYRICAQLNDHGLMKWNGLKEHGVYIDGIGEISANGIDVIRT